MTDRLALSALVNNHSGVLLRVAGLFARRGFNIQSLTVSQTENPEFSRMTIVSQADPSTFRQIEMQLLKLEDVQKVIRLEDGKTTSSELLLVKVRALNKDRPDVLKTLLKFGARVRDIGHKTITAELTGESATIDEFIEAISKHHIVELSRSGIAALASGDVSINDDEDSLPD